ncbi:hypothetical protein PVA44_01825 [Entomospira nematocerorum]|uniref:DUF2804 domain-containing protein n=1 Tax=Entomospira nematocerorum TaxID=2719987 RepID=A0A968GDF9_9SPIO|nr:hypothetical protein [Entomospira nematocera]NIZ47229.1 hypothetical protein [Entomospira nematocera]WDI34229.1 hypothetical protein PVA44_01825 [Entomospira nematocera]
MAVRRSKRYMRNTRNRSQLHGAISSKGLEVWRHFFWAKSLNTGTMVPVLLEYMLLNPTHKERRQQPYFHINGSSFAMVRCVRLGVDGVQPAHFFSMKDVDMSRRILSLRFGRNICLEDALTGQVVTVDKDIGVRFSLANAGSASWDLQVEKSQSYGYGFIASRWVTANRLIGLSWHVGGLKSLYTGDIAINDDELQVDASTSYGFQDKIWGGNIGNDWVKLYGGYLSSPDGKEIFKSDSLSFFRHERVILGKSEGHDYHIIYVHDGILYDFSSDIKRNVYVFHEQDKGDFIEILLEAVAVTQRLVIRLMVEKRLYNTIQYPYPSGGNLSITAITPVSGELELFRFVPLGGWEREIHQTIHLSVYESSNLCR